MPLSTYAHTDVMLTALRTAATHVDLTKTCQVTTAAATGTSATLSRTVQVGDYLSFNSGQNREVKRVTAVNGATATLDSALANSYPVGSEVGHAPKFAAGVVVPTGGGGYSRQPITWATPANDNLTINNASLPSFSVAGGNVIGGFALYTAQTGGQFLGSFLVQNVEGFGAAGTYQLTDADVNLNS